MNIQPFTVEDGLGIDSQDVSTFILNGVNDPSESPGVPAPISSCFTRPVLNEDGITYSVLTYDKIGEQDTDWALRKTDNLLGVPSDGGYRDGLFNFSDKTSTGDAVDTINEFLSLMAPPKAPYLLSIDSSQSGSTGKLSFDSTHQIPGYSYNNNLINSVVSKNAYCLGIFNGSTTISGTLNSAVSADPSSAWPANSFGPGNEGTLVLRVNGVILHTVDLTTFTSGNSTTGGSGFSLSASTPAQFSNGNKFTPIQYRTGSIIIRAAAQRPGYNVVIVEHVSSDTSTTTNEFYWFNSVDATPLSASGSTVKPVMTSSRLLSGVRYYNAGSLRFQTTVNNAYKDVYSSSNNAISVSSSHASFAQSSIPAANSNNDSLPIDISANINNPARIINTNVAVGLSVLHPIKSNLSVSNIQSTKILYDSHITGSELSEQFNTEDYRVSAVPVNASTAPTLFDSGVSLLTNSELQVSNGTLVYPKGDFRSSVDGGSIEYAPNGNPNYSSASGTRTFIRVFKNNSGSSKANFKINFIGASTTFAPVGVLSGNNISVEVKFPVGSLAVGTGWMDAYKDFATAQWQDGAGARSETLGAGRSLGNDWGLTVGTQTIANGENIYIRITAPASWSGSIDTLTLTWL